jgi:hypothetical protein
MGIMTDADPLMEATFGGPDTISRVGAARDKLRRRTAEDWMSGMISTDDVGLAVTHAPRYSA